MRTTPRLAVLALAGASLLACGGNVTTATGAGASGTMSTATGGGHATGGGVTTGTGMAGGVTTGPLDAGPLDASPHPEAGPPDAGTTCPGNGDPCTDCLSVSCTSDYCSCYGNVDCGELLNCWGQCAPNDAACSQACETAHPDGISAALLLSGCAGTQCLQGCPGNKPLSACDQCLYTKCDVQMNACVANAECVAYFACTKLCNGNATCVAQCQASHPNGVVDASKVNTCAAVSCPTPCM